MAVSFVKKDETKQVVTPINPLPVTESKTLTAFGESLVGQLHPEFQGGFEYTVDNTRLNTNVETNSGTVTQADAMAVMSTGTTTDSTACLESHRAGHYRAGMGGQIRFTALFTDPVADTEQLAGLQDETGSSVAFKNGYMVGYIGTTFGVHRFQDDTITTVAQADWDDPLDGDGLSGMTIDFTKLNVFFIQFQYLGAGAIDFMVEDDSTGSMFVFHRMLYANLNIAPSNYQPNFHMAFFVNNGTTTSDIVMKSASYGYFVQGITTLIETHQPIFSSGTQQKTGVTTETAILTIRNKTTYASKTNFLEIQILNLSASVEASAANNLAILRLVLGATLGGTPDYNDINTSDSMVDMDIAGTTVTGGLEFLTVNLAGKNDREQQDATILKFLIAPGETVTIAGSSENSATLRASILWRELF